MEFIMELLVEGFVEIMWLIFPKPPKMTERKKGWLEFFVALYAIALLVCIFIGGILLNDVLRIGYFLVFIPLGIIVLNIILSIVIKIIKSKRK